MPKSPKRKRHTGKNVKSKKPKPRSKSNRQRSNVRVNRPGRKNTYKKPKLSTKVKAPSKRQQVRQGKGARKQRVQPIAEITRPKRTEQKLEIRFKHVRSIDKKISLINGKGVDKVFKQQFKRKGGEPPLGLVVTVTDSSGRRVSDIAPPDMVINRANVKDFVSRFLKVLKNNNVRWRERNANLSTSEMRALTRGMNKKDKRQFDYDAMNPDNASRITVKFLYAKSGLN